MNKAFRFGVVVRGSTSRTAWIALAQRIEELGYSSLLFPDGLGTPLSVIPALVMAAAVTTNLRVGSFVFVNDYRNPALLARDVASLDCLSEGRVELGLGAGNWPRDFHQLGIPFDSAGVRVSRFMEGFSIIKQFFAGEPVNYAGKYYTISELRPYPRAAQQPPIMIGSGGRRMLTLAAREADIIMPVAMPGEDVAEKIGWVREAAGERFEHLEFSQIAFGIELTDGPVPAEPITPGGIPVEPRPMTTEQAVAYLQEQRERLGFSYIQIQQRQLENFVPVLARLNGK